VKRWKKPGMAAVLVIALALAAGCGYFESAITPIEAGQTQLEGRVVDALSRQGVPGAIITLSGKNDTTVISGEGGTFRFPYAATGKKSLQVSAPGYNPFALETDLTLDLNDIDSLFLVRTNNPPLFISALYPLSNEQEVPLTLQFSFAVADSDFARDYTCEALSFSFYFGDFQPPALVFQGRVDTLASRLYGRHPGFNSYIINAPDTALALTAGQTYFWKLVISDTLGDSVVHGIDSFVTRSSFDSTCPQEMALVEMETLSFCMDKYEFTNADYEEFDTLYTSADYRWYSQRTDGPVIFKSWQDARQACQSLGKRLCTMSEWEAASSGYQRWNYPYGPVYDSSKCNTELLDTTQNPFNGSAQAVGDKPDCVSWAGIYDLSGNVEEWIMLSKNMPFQFDQNTGLQVYSYIGGFWGSSERATSFSVKTTSYNYNDFIGFRCCKDIE